MSLEYLITTYGYAAILIGTLLEGETILILGGLFAHSGYLHLQGVIACAFIGSFCSDQFFFYLGRTKGKSWIEERKHWKSKVDKVYSLLNRYQLILIISFRFLYGLRTITPVVIGASGISPYKFFILNMISALLWASVIGSLGYLFGHTVQVLIGDIKKYELWLFVLILLLGVILWIFRLMRKRAKP